MVNFFDDEQNQDQDHEHDQNNTLLKTNSESINLKRKYNQISKNSQDKSNINKHNKNSESQNLKDDNNMNDNKETDKAKFQNPFIKGLSKDKKLQDDNDSNIYLDYDVKSKEFWKWVNTITDIKDLKDILNYKGVIIPGFEYFKSG